MQRDMLPELTTGTAIGISVAVAGNILISLALNLQKLAHKQIDSEKAQIDGRDGNHITPSLDSGRRPVSTVDEETEEGRESSTDVESGYHVVVEASNSGTSEGDPLLPFPRAPQSPGNYRASDQFSRSSSKRTLSSRIFPFKSRQKSRPVLLPVDVIHASRIRDPPKPIEEGEDEIVKDGVQTGNESDYLKSKLW